MSNQVKLVQQAVLGNLALELEKGELDPAETLVSQKLNGFSK